MAEGKKGWGKTVKGWFIVDEEEPAPSGPPPAANKGTGKPAAAPPPADDATDDIIRRYAGGGGGAKGAKPAAAKPDTSPARSPSGEAPPDFGAPAATTSAPAASSGGGAVPQPDAAGQIDFASVFKGAGISEAEADRVNRTLQLLSQLPAETPQPVKKQIVEASLNSFGVPIESIIESAVAEIEALHSCIAAGQAQTATLMEQSQARIEQLQKQIQDVQQVILAKQAEQRSLETAARVYGLKVQQILEFFGQELVGKVVKESPRLHEPEAK
jgi:hypothetical protein